MEVGNSIRKNRGGFIMGLRFRKSINLPGGFRINLSKSGAGFSWGVKGAGVTRIAKGKTQAAVSIPGAGISYAQDLDDLQEDIQDLLNGQNGGKKKAVKKSEDQPVAEKAIGSFAHKNAHSRTG